MFFKILFGVGPFVGVRLSLSQSAAKQPQAVLTDSSTESSHAPTYLFRKHFNELNLVLARSVRDLAGFFQVLLSDHVVKAGHTPLDTVKRLMACAGCSLR